MYYDSNLIFDEISYFSYGYTDFEIQLLFSSWGSDLNFLDKIKYSNVSAKSHWDFNPIRIVLILLIDIIVFGRSIGFC